MIQIAKTSDLLKLPEQLYGTIKRVGILNKKPILYGDVNLLNPNDLYYINGAKQIYRYIKSSIEDERGLIHRAGYLFNEIIYSGDPNLIDNGQLFYHYTLPYISVTSVEEGVITLSTKSIDENGNVTTTYTDYRVSPKPEIALVISDINKDTYYYIRNLDEDTTVDDVVYYAWKDANDDNLDIYFTESETPSAGDLLYKLVSKDMQALVGYSITNIILAKDIPTE